MSRKVVMLVETDFRDEEAIYPFYRLQEAGFVVDVATDQKKLALGKFGTPLQGTVALHELNANDYEGVVIPGGNEGPDRLRINPHVKSFVRAMNDQGKLVAAVCHGPWVLISAKIMQGKNATCYKSIVDDLENAGAIYHDEPVVSDGNLITSRHPRDLAHFMVVIVEYLAKS